ncbi:MAG: family 43 glycosylhydrolase [Muribaculaceae bacterium]|nr:family 43 glycosylhydrolase [Muribaculaceae bacterium]
MSRLLIFSVLLLCISATSQAAHPPKVHDPVMARGEDGRYYIFSTGVGLDVMSSTNMHEWRHESRVFDVIPQWAIDTVSGYRGHTWAPDISYHNGLWHLYYSCSTFGRNGSAIGLAVNKTLDPASPDFGWTDRGMVIASHRHVDNWNAIDPNLALSADSVPWLAFGSFWDGIQLVRLSADDYRTPIGAPVTIARRCQPGEGTNAIEAPFIFHHGDYYYLFVSFDYCCKGDKSTYKTVYGRSRHIDGPYVDQAGQPMLTGGGTLLFGPDDYYFGIGHCAVYNVDGHIMFISHAYDRATDGQPVLFVRTLAFNDTGWITPLDHPF